MKYSKILLSLTILLVIISAAFIAAKDVKKGGDRDRRRRSDKESQGSKPSSKSTDVVRSAESSESSEDSSKDSNWSGKPTNSTRPQKPSKSSDDSSSKQSSDDKRSDHGKKSRDSGRRRHSKSSSSSSSSSSSDSDSHRSHADLIISKDFCKDKKAGYYCVPGNTLDRVQCPGNKLSACGSGSFCATIGYRGLDYSCEKPFDPVLYCRLRGNGLHCAPNNTGSTGVWSCPSGKEVTPCPASAHCKEYSRDYAICASNVQSSSDSDSSSSSSSSTSESSHHRRRDGMKPRQVKKEESENERSSSDSGLDAVKALPVRRRVQAVGTSRPATEEEKPQKRPAVKESSESSAQVFNNVASEPEPEVELAPAPEPVSEPAAESAPVQELVEQVAEETVQPEVVEQLETPVEKSTKRDAHAQKKDDKKGKASVKQAGNVVAVYDVAAITSVGVGAVYITTTTTGLDINGILTTATGVYSILLGSPPDNPFVSFFVQTTVIDCVERFSIFSVPLCSTLTSIDNCNVTGSIILCPPTVTSQISCCGAPTTTMTVITEAVINAALTPTILISPLLSGVFTSTATSAILIAPTISTTVTIGTLSTADEITDECTRTFSFTSLSSIFVSVTETVGLALFNTGTNLLTLDCLASIVVVPTDPINGTLSFEICAQLTPATICESFIFNNVGQSLCVQLGGGIPIGLNQQVIMANVDAPNEEYQGPVVKSSGTSRRLAREEEQKKETVDEKTNPVKKPKNTPKK